MNDPANISAWLRLDDRTTTSGQPTEEQLADIRALGITHIINLGLHSHEKALPDEAASVSSLGMTYIHIPVDFGQPTVDDFAKFCGAMNDIEEDITEYKVHVHCIVNARVSAFFFRYNREVKAMSEPEARSLMEKIWKPDGVWAAFIGDPTAEDEGARL